MMLDGLKKEWKKEENRSFVGWNFSSLEGRMIETPLAWDYKSQVLKYLKSSMLLLDMGTGGGEFLKTLGHPMEMVSVTEGYKPNYELCLNTLAPLGAKVKWVDEKNKLDFGDEIFDLVINRHETFDVSEVKRVLKHGGVFITQQVGHMNNVDLSRWLLENPAWEYECDNKYDDMIEVFKGNGFEVLMNEECMIPLKFLDVGALVYFMKVIEWEFPEFSVEKHFDRLLEVKRIIDQKGFIESLEHRYILIARNLSR